MTERFAKPRIALIDYNSFDNIREYNDSISELIDILLRKYYKTYGLIPIDGEKELVPVDKDIYGIIPYSLKNISLSGTCLSNNIKKVVGNFNEKDILVISDNAKLLSILEEQNYSICFINNGHNDTLSLNGDEINHIQKINKLLK